MAREIVKTIAGSRTMIPSRVTDLSTNELRQELARAISMTAEAVAHLAACWTELERRGEDLSDLKIWLAPYLRDVANGRLAPEAVLSFAGHRMVLRWVARRPLEEQRLLAAGGRVRVEDPEGGVRHVPARDISVLDLRLATGVEEGPQDTSASMTPEMGPPSGSGRSRTRRRPATALLTEAEHADLLKRARADGLSLSDMIRRTLGLKPIGGSPR